VTEDELKAIEARAEAAWAGPWTIEYDRNDQANIYAGPDCWLALLPHQCVAPIEQEQKRNAAFVAAARTDVPALVAEVRRLRDALEEIAQYAPNHATLGQAMRRAQGALGGSEDTPAAHRKLTVERAIDIAKGCYDYNGGHAGQLREAFHHGIGTVINALVSASNSPDTLQNRTLEAIGTGGAAK
jgi:hypothetical protein